MAFSSYGEKAKPAILSACKKFGIELDAEKWKSEEGKIDHTVKLLKSSREGIFYGIVYEPDTEDSQGDFASAEEIEKAAHSFLPNAVMNVHHQTDLDVNDVQIVESYLAPCDFAVGIEKIRKGTWVLVSKVLNVELRKEIEEGVITGYSLEGTASRLS
jgi:hypothetical protein